MIDKFKSFLAGSPYRMDDGHVEGWAYQVAVIQPSVLRKWHDTDFCDDVWAKDGGYYAAARKKLSALSAFKQHCAEYGEILQALKLLVEFFITWHTERFSRTIDVPVKEFDGVGIIARDDSGAEHLVESFKIEPWMQVFRVPDGNNADYEKIEFKDGAYYREWTDAVKPPQGKITLRVCIRKGDRR